MEALTGQNASFLRVSSGSDQGSLSPPSSTRTYQESPTARTRLVSCPPVAAGSRGEVATPAQVSYSVSVPVGSVVELTPADAIKYLSTFDHSVDTEQLPLANGGGDTPQQPILPNDDLPEQPLPLTDDLPQQPLPLTDALPQQPLPLTDDLPQQPLPLTDDLLVQQVRSHEHKSFGCSHNWKFLFNHSTL